MHSSGMTRRFLLAFALAAPLLSLGLLQTNALLALAPIFASHMLMLYPTLVANSQWWGPVFTRFETAEEQVWLTIDDGPSPEHTLRILDLLEQFDARATFFTIGERAEKYPHLLTEILTRGHTLANHTFTHPAFNFWCAGPKRIAREIDRCAEVLRATPERPNRLFRAPVGLKSPFLHPVLAPRNLMLMGWTVRGLDTVGRDPTQVAERIERGALPGAIILLHEAHRTAKDPDFHIRCLELTLQRLTARGYRFVIPRLEQLRTNGGGI